MAKLYIYGTVYNNAQTIERTLVSIKKLHPYKIYVTDNYSNDGSYEILKKVKNVVVTRLKCKRGRGRDTALRMLLKEANLTDKVFYIDFDISYDKKFIDYINSKAQILKDNEVYSVEFGALSNAKTNLNWEWKNLNGGEDWERIAHGLSLGYTMYSIDINRRRFINYPEKKSIPPKNQLYDDYELPTSIKFREFRYEKSYLLKIIRAFIFLIDTERGLAFRNFKDFYNLSRIKKFQFKLIYLSSYVLANILGLYAYDKTLDNAEYIKRSKKYIIKEIDD